MRPGALRRAAHYDGWIAIGTSEDGMSMALDAEAFGAMVDRLRQERAGASNGQAFDVAIFGLSAGAERDTVQRYADAGATWWLESLSPMRGSIDALVSLVEAGPPTAGSLAGRPR